MVLILWDLDAASAAGNAAVFAKRAEEAYKAAKTRWEADTNSIETSWQFGRACFDLAATSTKDKQKAKIAEEGIAVCTKVVEAQSNSVEGRYYLAMNLGELAETKTLGALRLVDRMETEFNLVVILNAGFDYAGADRGLGLIYRDAPGWPTSIGSSSKAREHLEQAVKLAPSYPENLLNLIESELKWGESDAAKKDLKQLDDLWPQDQKALTGEAWESSWLDWTKRRDEARKKCSKKGK